MTPLKPDEIKLMRETCRLAARVLKYTGSHVRAGITTNELDRIAEDYTQKLGASSAPLGYHGFPKSICTSVNHCICHGVPDSTVLKEGDVVNIDITTFKDGFHGDTSATFFVGNVSDEAKDLTDCAFQAMHKGIEAIRPSGTTGDIGFAISKFVTKRGYYVVRDIGGHGIGRKFHDEPFVPSYGKKGRGEPLIPWTCITVEPMVNQTSAGMIEKSIPESSIKYYETEDACLSAQFEHTVLITDTGYEVLTLLPEGSS